jgi:hypothetical protein
MSFFTKNGKQLKSFAGKLSHRCTKNVLSESVVSIYSEEISTLQFTTPVKNNFITICKKLSETIFQRTSSILSFYKSELISLTKIQRPQPSVMWLSGSVLSFTIVALIIIASPWHAKPKLQDRYSIYSSKPLTLQNIQYQIYTRDSRSQRINAIFKQYKCPLEGLGEVFVYEADKNNIPWWLTAAMSFQESSCGKKTPEPDGTESYNAWGWAVYGDNVQSFDNWVRGIETVSEYMSNRFFSKNVTDPCEIMKTYTPPSNGSWCKGVQYFGQEIQDFKSPEPTEIQNL